jgi:hypothetical protein
LFRPTSPVSKIIANYNKLVGLKYLWQALALPIHELNDLGATEYSNGTGKNFLGIFSLGRKV